jgi:hypothetical protein
MVAVAAADETIAVEQVRDSARVVISLAHALRMPGSGLPSSSLHATGRPGGLQFAARVGPTELVCGDELP